MILAALLLGCPVHRPICVFPASVAVPGRVRLADGADCTGTPVVQEIVVRRGDTLVWRATHEEGATLDGLTYGVVPPGFESPRPAEPVQAGDTLTFHIRGRVDRGTGELTLEGAPAP